MADTAADVRTPAEGRNDDSKRSDVRDRGGVGDPSRIAPTQPLEPKGDDRADPYELKDLSDESQRFIDEAKQNVKDDKATALSAARKLFALSVGHRVPIFTVAEQRALDHVYDHVLPRPQRPVVQGYAARAIQEVYQHANVGMYDPEFRMYAPTDAAMQKAIAHAVDHYESVADGGKVHSDSHGASAASPSWQVSNASATPAGETADQRSIDAQLNAPNHENAAATL